MKGMIRYGFILALICTVASGVLAAVNSFTKVRILTLAQTHEEMALSEIMPEAASFTPVKSADGQVVYYKGQNKNHEFVGAAFKASGKGYSSIIEVMAGMTKAGRFTAIKVISHNETPGLGSRVAEPAFGAQFSRKGLQDLGEVAAITGATISSRAVIDAVKEKASQVQELIRDEK